MPRRWMNRGRDAPRWPVLLLILVVLVPTACVLWLMQQATRNEQLAVRQRLAEAYQPQLARVGRRFQEAWQGRLERIGRLVAELPAEQAFAECVRSGLADSLIVLDGDGGLAYPAASVPHEAPSMPPAWKGAEHREFVLSDAQGAAAIYRQLSGADDPRLAARAIQAEARCLARAGQVDRAIALLAGPLQQGELGQAVDASGRWIAADADLRILELAPSGSSPFTAAAVRLQQRLGDYRPGRLPSAQRWFLMQRARSLAGASLELPTWEAEQMAAQWMVLRGRRPSEEAVGQYAEDRWQVPLGRHRGVALLRTGTIAAALQGAMKGQPSFAGMRVQALRPGDPSAGGELLSVGLAPNLPGWQLALEPGGAEFWDSAAARRKRYYLGAAVLMILTTSALALMIGRAYGRQMRVSRLKNDLVATVSHELKTPLASIRLLVDTLLDGSPHDPERQREYLGLIARENVRLTRLIDNFLTFSRLERGKPVIDCRVVEPAVVIQAAAEACRQRFSGPDCWLQVDVPAGLPTIWADPDALTTVLLNLLDNAYKYTGPTKRVIVQARSCGSDVQIQVQDNGLGLSARAARRVFERFYRVDNRLARVDQGCGLGLSIVRYLVEAHGGQVRVESQPGRGSTFIVQLPARAAPPARAAGATQVAL